MLENRITFDRVIRWLLLALGTVAGVLLLNRLSGVLLPFFVAWILSYLIYPLVCVLQYRCRLRSRVASIVVAMSLMVGILTLAAMLIVPPIIQEAVRTANLMQTYFHDSLLCEQLLTRVQDALHNYSGSNSLLQLLHQSSVIDAIDSMLMQLWNFLAGTIDVVLGVFSSLIVIIYMFFILMDYEKISNGWKRYIPAGKRPFASMVVEDVKCGMNAYFRGQSLIAFLVGILCCIGFSIIGFPMAIGIGLLIGVLNLVPYLQIAGFIPIALLAFVEAADTGRSFWMVLLGPVVVVGVVQLIQDFYLTPRIMGRVMGLKPAIILLSLSVWGSLLGIIGLIIALPLTTLLISYYRRFVLNETDETGQNG